MIPGSSELPSGAPVGPFAYPSLYQRVASTPPEPSFDPPSRRTRSAFPRRPLASFDHCESVASTVPLPPSVLARLRASIRSGTPLLVKLSLSADDRCELLRDWCSHVQQHWRGRYQTQTPGYGNGVLPLGEVWNTPQRIESGLNGETANPLRDWLDTSSDSSSALHQMAQVQDQLDAIAAEWCQELHSTIETKAFIAGCIEPSGGPTHYDVYDNLALVLTGSKIFYHAPHPAFEGVDQHGRENERLSINPFDELSLNDPLNVLHTHAPEGTPLAPLWREATIEAGDILFLPHRWWHWVWSTRHTVMTNVWIDRSSG